MRLRILSFLCFVSLRTLGSPARPHVEFHNSTISGGVICAGAYERFITGVGAEERGGVFLFIGKPSFSFSLSFLFSVVIFVVVFVVVSVYVLQSDVGGDTFDCKTLLHLIVGGGYND